MNASTPTSRLPTATTGTSACPSRPSPAPRTSRASRSTRITTRRRPSSPARTSSSSASATPAWTSPSTPATTPQNTYLAHRRGAHVIPKYLFGKPIDQIGGAEWIPGPIRFRMLGLMVRARAGQDGGLRAEEARPHARPRAPDDLGPDPRPALTRGDHPRSRTSPRLGKDTVRFDDGSEVHADLVVYCTGYRITFPFFDPEFFNAPDNRVGLYKMIFPPQLPHLYFVGLVQPLGAIMPIAERQSKLFAEHITGGYSLPRQARDGARDHARPGGEDAEALRELRSGTRSRSTTTTT